MDDPAPKWRKLRRRWEQEPTWDNRMAFYEAYLDSNEWVLKRKKVLARDNHQCQTWLAHTGPLEVHHKTYENLGDEPLSDLITVCRRCHEQLTSVIRADRYSTRVMPTTDTQRSTPLDNRKIFDNVVQVPTLQDSRRVTPAAPQWATGRSPERIYARVEAGERKARKD
jgi:hypothetical protein